MRRTVVGAALLAVLVGACSSPPGDPAATAAVRLDEFRIAVDSPLAAGPVGLTVDNQGEFAHTLLVTDADGAVVAGTDLVAPGTTLDLELDLPAGAYRLSCRIVVQDPDGTIIDHFEEGMRAAVTVVDV